MPEHPHIPDFILYFLKFFILLCVLYGRIARLKWQVFAGEPAGVLVGLRLLNLEFKI
jgi:hypothetical protein